MEFIKTNVYNIYPTVRYAVHRRTKKGWKIETRTIRDHELLLVERGRGFIIIEGIKYTCGPGMLFYFFPGLKHSLETDDSDPFSFLAVHFSFVFLNNTDGIWNINSDISRLPLNTVQNTRNYRVLSESMSRLIDNYSKHLPGWELITRSFLQIFIYHIFQDINMNNMDYSAKAKIDIVAKYIAANIDKRILACELAPLVNVTPDYISRIFKKHTGYSLIKYIHKCKIEMAKIYLLEKNMKLSEIAQKLGFSDEFHFSKVFKKIEGISPSRFLLQI